MTRLIDKDITGYVKFKKALEEGYKLIYQSRNKINDTLETKYYVAKMEE